MGLVIILLLTFNCCSPVGVVLIVAVRCVTSSITFLTAFWLLNQLSTGFHKIYI